MISNLFLNRDAANCIQSRAMLRAFSKNHDVDAIFKDNSSLPYRIYRAVRSRFTDEIIFTRSFSLAVLCKFIGAECIYELHELHSKRDYKILCGRSKLSILFISESLKEAFLKSVARPDITFFVKHDGCDVQKISEIKSGNIQKKQSPLGKLAKGKKILLHTGSSYKFDDYRFEEIVNKIPKDWIFAQLGDVKKSTSLKYSNDSRVAFLPRCSHIEALHAHQDADCLLYLNFPESRMYNFTSPLKLFEYIISGKPFISTIGGATDEILQTLQEYGVYEEMESYLELVSTGNQNDIFLKQANLLKKKVSWDERAHQIINSYVRYSNK